MCGRAAWQRGLVVVGDTSTPPPLHPSTPSRGSKRLIGRGWPELGVAWGLARRCEEPPGRLLIEATLFRLHRLLAGYAAGGVCYAVGRVLTVRGERLRGAWAHTGVHVFANMGNLFLLRYLR